MVALTGHETLWVLGQEPTNVSAASEFQTTTGAIAALGGGGGGGFVKTQRFIDFGNTNTATTADGFIGWNSSVLAPKFQTIPASTGSLQVLIVTDVYGNAGVYNINIVGTSYAVTEVGGSVMLLDTLMGWVGIFA